MLRLFWLLASLSLLTGCGFIGKFFPDKEKDYRFTQELPELQIPQELTQPLNVKPSVSVFATQPTPEPQLLAPSSMPTVPSQASTPIAKESVPTPTVTPENLTTIPAIPTPSDYAKDIVDADTPTAVTIHLHKTAEQEIIQVNQNIPRTWRLLSKAMMQQDLEIVERNIEDHYFVVQYEPQAKALQDSSFWDDLSFIFGDENNQEQAYRILLNEQGQQTDITVQNSEKQLCKAPACTQLLQVLKHALEKSLQEK